MLYTPGSSVEHLKQAQTLCDTFVASFHQGNFWGLFTLIEEPQIQSANDLTKFWLLQAIAGVLSHSELYNLSANTLEIRQAVHRKAIEYLVQRHKMVLGQR